MTGLVASEWLKTRSLRSVWWSAGLTVVAVLLAAAIDRDGVFPLAGYMVLIVVATSSGAAAIVGEYASGLIRATAVAVPARSHVILAKAVVQICLWTVVSAVIVGGLLIVGGPVTTVTAAEILGATLLGPVCALVGLGLAVLLRQAGAAYVTGILLLLALPQLLTGENAVVRALHHAMILPAWQRLTLAYGPPEAVGDVYTSATEAWLSYLLWPSVVLGAALLVHRRRDV
jgi:ABC-2 type transport system permease protein